MKTITSANKFISDALGKQKIDTKINYRKITFCSLLKRNETYIAFNFLTRELIELTEEEYTILSLDEFFSDKILSSFIEKWFLVPVDNDDIALCNQIINLIHCFDKKRNITSYTILTTTDCNARCFYCYEAGVAKKYMLRQTAVDVADFIQRKSGGEKVEIRWFGGEPLYNVDAIDTITNELTHANINFVSSMVSNGYLFDDETIKRAKNNWKLNNVQITLDGTEDIYNRCKNYIYNETSPYKMVLNNIKKLISNDIYVTIRLNMDSHNKNDLYNLLDELYEFLGDNKNYRVYPHLLYENSGNLQIDYSAPEHLKLTYDFFELEDYAFSKKLLKISRISNSVKASNCMADNDAAVVILPDGMLSKCEHVLENEIIGSIYSDEMDQEIIASWKKIRPLTEKCKSCKVYTDCQKLHKCHTVSKMCYESERLDMLRKHDKMIWHTYDKTIGNLGE